MFSITVLRKYIYKQIKRCKYQLKNTDIGYENYHYYIGYLAALNNLLAYLWKGYKTDV